MPWRPNKRLVADGFRDLKYLPPGRSDWDLTLASLAFTVLRSHPGVDAPATPKELADWVNRLLGVKPYKGVGPRHPGIQRPARWVANRVATQPHGRLKETELAEVARRWLPEHFKGVETARMLDELDPRKHRAAFELALNDPNPDIARRARKLTEGKGFSRSA